MAKSTIALGFMLVLLLALGCAPAMKTEVPVTVTCDQFTKQANIVQDISVKMGNRVVVTLCSNPTTGFQWPEKAQIGNLKVLEQKGYKFAGPAKYRHGRRAREIPFGHLRRWAWAQALYILNTAGTGRAVRRQCRPSSST